jgi:integrase
MSKSPTVHLLAPIERAGGPVYLVKWREPGGTQVKKRVGPAWVERGEVPPGHRRATRHPGWVKRRGRSPEGYFTEDSAIASVQALIERTREERAREAVAPDPALFVTFDEVASAWLEHRRTVGGCKRTTLKDYGAMLRQPDDAPRKRGRAPAARLMTAFGGRAAASITRREVSRWLAELDRDPALSARAVNKHRAVMYSVFVFGCRDDTYGLPVNPVVGTEKRREPDPAEIITYTPSEVMAIAEAARRGAHRELIRMQVGEDEQDVRRREDDQDACLIVVAAFCGLRMGELLALRWRHVVWHAQRLHIQRAYSLGEEDSPKGRRGRTVPLADQPAQALAQLSQRPMFTRNSDLVFCSRTGEHLDGSALRRRFKAARDAAIAESQDMPALRFHDLRHTFGTLAAQGFDLVNVQAMMGHADSRTTSRYLHARPAAEDAAKLSRIFAADASSAVFADLAVPT